MEVRVALGGSGSATGSGCNSNGSSTSTSSSSSGSGSSSSSSGYGSANGTPNSSMSMHYDTLSQAPAMSSSTPVATVEPTTIPIATVAAMTSSCGSHLSSTAMSAFYSEPITATVSPSDFAGECHPSQLQSYHQGAVYHQTQHLQHPQYQHQQQQQQMQQKMPAADGLMASPLSSSAFMYDAYGNSNSNSNSNNNYQSFGATATSLLSAEKLPLPQQTQQHLHLSQHQHQHQHQPQQHQTQQQQQQQQQQQSPTYHSMSMKRSATSGSSNSVGYKQPEAGSVASSTATTKPQAAATAFYARPSPIHASSSAIGRGAPMSQGAYYDPQRYKAQSNYLGYHTAAAMTTPPFQQHFTPPHYQGQQQSHFYAAAKSPIAESSAYVAPIKPLPAPAAVRQTPNAFFDASSGGYYYEKYEKYLYPTTTPASTGVTATDHTAPTYPSHYGPPRNSVYPNVSSNYAAPYVAMPATAGATDDWPWSVDFPASNFRPLPSAAPNSSRVPTATVQPTSASYMQQASNSAKMGIPRDPLYLHDKRAYYAQPLPSGSTNNTWSSSASPYMAAHPEERTAAPHPVSQLARHQDCFAQQNSQHTLQHSHPQAQLQQQQQQQQHQQHQQQQQHLQQQQQSRQQQQQQRQGFYSCSVGQQAAAAYQQLAPQPTQSHCNYTAQAQKLRHGHVAMDLVHGPMHSELKAGAFYDLTIAQPNGQRSGGGPGSASSTSGYDAYPAAQAGVAGPGQHPHSHSHSHSHPHPHPHLHLQQQTHTHQTPQHQHQHQHQHQQQQQQQQQQHMFCPVYEPASKAMAVSPAAPIHPYRQMPLSVALPSQRQNNGVAMNFPYAGYPMPQTPLTASPSALSHLGDPISVAACYNTFELANSANAMPSASSPAYGGTSNANEKDDAVKNLSLRDFLSTWNEDEEEYAPSISSVAGTAMEKEHATFVEQQPPAVLLQAEEQEGDASSIGPKIHVGISVESGIGLETSQYINLPDIIIDIEKSNPPSKGSALAADELDVEKELDELQIKKAKYSNEPADQPTVVLTSPRTEPIIAPEPAIDGTRIPGADVETKSALSKLPATPGSRSDAETPRLATPFENEYKTFIDKIVAKDELVQLPRASLNPEQHRPTETDTLDSATPPSPACVPTEKCQPAVPTRDIEEFFLANATRPQLKLRNRRSTNHRKSHHQHAKSNIKVRKKKPIATLFKKKKRPMTKAQRRRLILARRQLAQLIALQRTRAGARTGAQQSPRAQESEQMCSATGVSEQRKSETEANAEAESKHAARTPEESNSDAKVQSGTLAAWIEVNSSDTEVKSPQVQARWPDEVIVTAKAAGAVPEAAKHVDVQPEAEAEAEAKSQTESAAYTKAESKPDEDVRTHTEASTSEESKPQMLSQPHIRCLQPFSLFTMCVGAVNTKEFHAVLATKSTAMQICCDREPCQQEIEANIDRNPSSDEFLLNARHPSPCAPAQELLTRCATPNISDSAFGSASLERPPTPRIPDAVFLPTTMAEDDTTTPNMSPGLGFETVDSTHLEYSDSAAALELAEKFNSRQHDDKIEQNQEPPSDGQAEALRSPPLLGRSCAQSIDASETSIIEPFEAKHDSIENKETDELRSSSEETNDIEDADFNELEAIERELTQAQLTGQDVEQSVDSGRSRGASPISVASDDIAISANSTIDGRELPKELSTSCAEEIVNNGAPIKQNNIDIDIDIVHLKQILQCDQPEAEAPEPLPPISPQSTQSCQIRMTAEVCKANSDCDMEFNVASLTSPGTATALENETGSGEDLNAAQAVDESVERGTESPKQPAHTSTIIPKLSDLCKNALNSDCCSRDKVDKEDRVEQQLLAAGHDVEYKNERELSVEEALAEMYRQVGVTSDGEDVEEHIETDSSKSTQPSESDVVLINLEEILEDDNNLYVLQCDLNENILRVVAQTDEPNDGTEASETDEVVARLHLMEDSQQTDTGNTLQLVRILNNVENENEDRMSDWEVVVTPTSPPQAPMMMTTYCGPLPGGDESSVSQFDLPSIHHEEIVPDNLKKYERERFLKYMHAKYVQQHISRFYHAHRILKKYRRRFLKRSQSAH